MYIKKPQNLHLLILLFLLFGCWDKSDKNKTENLSTAQKLLKQNKMVSLDGRESIKLATPQGHVLTTYLSYSLKHQVQGLSGLPSQDFNENDAMLFFYLQDNYHRFWMPGTFFDLDIFFLDENLRIVDVERDVPHHPSRTEPPVIPTTKTVFSRHVFEMRADSPVSKKLQINDRLHWLDSSSLLPAQIKAKIQSSR